MSEKLLASNPFSNAKVVGVGIEPESYHRQEPGIERGNPAFVMSRGELMTFAQCPHRWLAGYRPKETDASDWGSLIDCRVLDRNRFNDKYAIAPATYLADGRKKGDPQIEKPWNRNATVCREWEEAQGNKTIIKADELAESDTAIKSLFADDYISQVLLGSDHQVMVVAEYSDRETGIAVPVKILIDIVPGESSGYQRQLFDLKTSVSADPARWPRIVFERGYHVQGAFYLDVYVAAIGEDRIEFGHIVQENFAPFETSKFVLSSEFMTMGRDAYIFALRKYCQCLKDNQWPSYPPSHLNINGWNYADPEAWMIGKL
jgi:hypothetical protein